MLKRISIWFLVPIWIAVTVSHAWAQDPPPSQSSIYGSTPRGIAPGTPVGSYSLSNVESIDLYSGKPNVVVPILRVGGRGTAGYTIVVPLGESTSSFVTEHKAGCTPCNDPGFMRVRESKGMVWSRAPKYEPGIVSQRTTLLNPINTNPQDPNAPPNQWESGITRIVFTSQGGSDHVLWDEQIGGYESTWNPFVFGHVPSLIRGRIFSARDGSGLTFISDSDVEINGITFYEPSSGNGTPTRENGATGYLKMADGAVYRFVDGRAQWIRDRNGNLTTFTYSTAGGIPTLTKITDSLGRDVNISYGAGTDTLTYSGFGGASRSIAITYSSLQNNLRPNSGYQVGNIGALFPAYPVNGIATGFDNYTEAVNPGVLSTITLPDGRSWHFYYNAHVELARVETPSGAAAEYDYWAGVEEDQANGFYPSGQIGAIPQYPNRNPTIAIYRRLKERREYANGGSTATGKKTYSRFVGSATETKVEVQAFDLDGTTLLARHNHYFVGRPWMTMFTGHTLLSYPYGMVDEETEGKEIKTESLDLNNGAVLTRSESQWVGATCLPRSDCASSPGWSPHLQSVQTSVLDLATSQYLVSKQTFSYDIFDNQTDVFEYGFGTNTPGSLLRHSHTDYVTTNNGVDYTSTDIFLRSLPLRQWVKGVDPTTGQELQNYASYTEFAYDESAYATLPYGSVSGWVDIGMQPRGMATTVKRWLNLPSATYLQSHMQYDQFGNVKNVWDAKGSLTQTDYASNYGYAFPTNVTTAIPDPSGLHGSQYPLVTSTSYDLSTGLVTSTTDVNQQTTNATYAGVLDRLTQVTKPDGARVRYDYSDTPGDLYVQTLTDQDATRSIETRTYFDNLGRPTRSFLYDGTASTPWTVTDAYYDGIGRVSKVSNPYRVSSPSGTLPATCSVCTTTIYDGLSRAISVTTPDSAVVKTAYSGNRVLVADQNSSDSVRRKRISVTDALGRLREVWEVTGGDSWTEAVTFPGWSDVQAGYRTTYDYDALDSLTKVTQGTQSPREFSYDSLKRLLSATNPESGTINYQYDSNSNLLVKTDARGASAHYDYDALNRVKRRWYNGESSQSYPVNNVPALPSPVAATAEVNYHYDSATNGKGLLTSVSSTVSTYTFSEYDTLGRVKAASQTLGNQTYSISNIVYDLAGHVTTMTYPSGRVVNYNYDIAGRLADKDANNLAFTGNLGEGGSSMRTYTSGNIYDAAGRMTKEQFGTTTPIFNKLFYNVRGQLAEIRAGTTYTGPTDTGWQRGAIINFYGNCWGMCGGSNSTTPMPENNGNLRIQQISIPRDDNAGYENRSDEFLQFFEYDSLNRLKFSNQGNWRQEYEYDRYGNRTINTAAGHTYELPDIKAFEVQTATNRLYSPGDFALPDASRRMQYDDAGNLKRDTYSGQGDRTYDAENRMVTAQGGIGSALQYYSYDGDGQRIKLIVDGVETWHVYGVGGELLAEYAANSAASSPQKEYGYRNGQLLITAGTEFMNAPPPTALGATSTSSNTNVTLSWNGTAQKYRVERKAAGESNFGFLITTTTPSYQDNSAQNGHAYLYKVCAANSSGTCISNYSNMVLGARFYFPRDPVICASSDAPCGELTPMRHEHINELREAVNAVRGLAGDPLAWVGQTVNAGDTIFKNDVQDLRTKLDESLQHLGIQISDYEDHTLAGAPNGTAIKAIHIRQLRARTTSGSGSAGSGGSGGSSFAIHWLVADQLGTPRMIFDQSGDLTVTDQYGNYVRGVTRHDYLPFGEELFAGTGGRTPAQGYSVGDGVRQQFTSKERDIETGLDYFINRYYSSTQGRFTSVDPTLQSIDPANPQTLNRYTYALNNPLAFIDPDGLDPLFIGSYDQLTDEQKRLFETYVQKNYAEELKNPLFSAESFWNNSAAVANGDAAAGPNSRLLDDGQLTNFIGVTKMLEKRGVIDQVASISEIHGDKPEGKTYRVYGELKNNTTAVEAIKKAFTHNIPGKGHGEYSESRREQGLFGAPNGQVNRVPTGTGVDIDVDYRCVLCPGHVSKGGVGSDIRVGRHYEDSRKRYGPMPALSRTKAEVRIKSLY